MENAAAQINFILFCKSMHKLVSDVKVIPGEGVVLQHHLLVCNMKIIVQPLDKHRFTHCLRVWKIKDAQTSCHFQEVFDSYVITSAGVAHAATEEI